MVQRVCERHEFTEVIMSTNNTLPIRTIQCRFCGASANGPKVTVNDLTGNKPTSNYTINITNKFPDGELTQKTLFNKEKLEFIAKPTDGEHIRIAKYLLRQFNGISIEDNSGTNPYISRAYGKECVRIHIKDMLEELFTCLPHHVYTEKKAYYDNVLKELELL